MTTLILINQGKNFLEEKKMTPNPKITNVKEVYPEIQDYPRFTSSTQKLLKGIQEFKEKVRGWIN